MSTEPNVELFQKVVDQIAAHPELHRQSDFAIGLTADYTPAFRPETTCHTAHCFAGWAIVLSGDYACSRYETFYEISTGKRVDAAQVAKTLLGIDESTAWHPMPPLGIFNAGISRKYLFDRANEICGGQLTIPANAYEGVD